MDGTAGVGQSEDHRVATGAAQHHADRAAVERKRRQRAFAFAAFALHVRIGHSDGEEIPVAAAGGVAIQRHDVVTHTRSPEGPKRSVLMRSGARSYATKALATASTKDVGPHTKARGCDYTGQL